MSEKKLFYKRAFLNRTGFHSTALIFVEFIKNISRGELNKKTGKRKKDCVWYNTELKISDCGRIIDLEIDTYSKSAKKNSVRKLNILINTLTRFRDIFIKEMEIKQ